MAKHFDLDYKNECKKAMKMLNKDPRVIFLGQTVKYDGSPMFKSLEDVDYDKKIELPIIEDTQMGMSIGLALEGYIPVSIYPRFDFLICAVNQLINHLDKIEEMSKGEFHAGVIIRTQIGNTKPLHPGCQHCGDYTNELSNMCKNILILKPFTAETVLSYYKLAYERALDGKSTVIVEVPTGGWKK